MRSQQFPPSQQSRKNGSIKAKIDNGAGGSVSATVKTKDLPWQTHTGENADGSQVNCFQTTKFGNKIAISHTQSSAAVNGTIEELEQLGLAINEMVAASKSDSAQAAA